MCDSIQRASFFLLLFFFKDMTNQYCICNFLTVLQENYGKYIALSDNPKPADDVALGNASS